MSSPDVSVLVAEFLATQIDTLDMLLIAERPASVMDNLPTRCQSLAGETELLAADLVADSNDFFTQQRWPLVCVFEPDIKTITLTRLLARIRDLHADRVLHIAGIDNWSLADSLALGFRQLPVAADSSSVEQSGELAAIQAKLSEQGLRVFEFDIRTYKPAPDWLNAKNWANPERWDKHRW